MKNSKEMADSVFKIRDEYLEKQRKRRLKIKKAAFIGSSVCVFCLIIEGYIKFESMNIPYVTNPDILLGTENSEIIYKPKRSTETADTNKDTDLIKASPNSKETQSDVFKHSESQNTSSQISSRNPNILEDILEEADDNSESGIEENQSTTYFEQEDDNAEITPTPDDIMQPFKDNDDDIGEGEEDEEIDNQSYETWEIDDIYQCFPEILFDNKYCCLNTTISVDMLELAVADITIDGYNIKTNNNISASVVVYSFYGSREKGEVAILFEGRSDYIVYKMLDT